MKPGKPVMGILWPLPFRTTSAPRPGSHRNSGYGGHVTRPGSIGEADPVKTYEHSESGGRCAGGCGTILSRYNPQAMCAPCSRITTLSGGEVGSANRVQEPVAW